MSDAAATPPADIHQRYDAAVKLKDQGDLEGAVAALQEIVSLDPSYSLAYAALGVYLQKLGKYDDAVAAARKVTELQPNDPFSFSQLSVICQRCGRIMEAEDAMARARMLQMPPR